jgi:hypothetical protein
MKIIRGKPATGNPPKIICTGCGKRADEAGIAVPTLAVEKGYRGDGPVMMIDEDQVQPLCEDCVAALLRSEMTDEQLLALSENKPLRESGNGSE